MAELFSSRPARGLIWLLAGLLTALSVQGQIDPEKRRAFQAAGEFPLHERGPLAAYFYYYHNEPEFFGTNLALRLVVAPVYLDSELGIRHALGQHTDLGLGVSGGGFADTYSEVRGGSYKESESFLGHGGEASVSVYHLFNPGQVAPLYGVIKAAVHTAFYSRTDKTAPTFEIPGDQTQVRVRTGLRLGGREPSLLPQLAGEISGWYEGAFRLNPQDYGFKHDREINSAAHLFWARALLAYTFPKSQSNFEISMTIGSGINVDRLSAPRIGGDLPLVAEFPLMMPGYYAQELSARGYSLLNGKFYLPLDSGHRVSLAFYGSAGYVDFVPGLQQPGNFNSGLGGGIVYRSKSNAFQLGLGYGYGFQAIRADGRGAQSVGFVAQVDLEAQSRTGEPFWRPLLSPETWRGVFRIFGGR